MALSSSAHRLATDPEPSVATVADPAPVSAAARVIAKVRAILADRSENRLTQLIAGKVFLVRVFSALLALGSQVLLARWMGSFDYGIFIYVWTWVLMIGALSDLGLSSAARRFIPEYTELKSPELLPGYVLGQTQAGISQSYDWPNLALKPNNNKQQLAMVVLMGAAWYFGAPAG